MLLFVIAITILAVLVAVRWKKVQCVRDKLKWAGAAPGYPVVGNALDFRDSTKVLSAMSTLSLEHNGICYVELLGRPILLVTDHSLLEHVLSSNSLLRKSQDYETLRDWLEDGILLTHGPKWRKSRKILTPSFHFAILEQFVDVFEKPASTLVKILDEDAGKESVDIYPYITNFGLDLICETAMGVQMDIQQNPNSDYLFAVNQMCRIVEERAFNPMKMFNFTYRLTPDYYLQKKCVKLLHSVSNSVIETRRREVQGEREVAGSPRKRMAFLDHLLKYRDENGAPLPHGHIRQEVDTFMFAGHDTTSAAISFTLYCLATHPDIQEKALKEVREIVGDGRKVTYRHLQDMKYLEAAIKEALRLYPSVPFYARLIEEDAVYDGDKVLPRGLTVIIFAFGVNRNPKTYENPHRYDPSRWTDAESRMPYSYLPFSAGPRNCIGQKFAMLVMKSVLAKILTHFELLPASPRHDLILAAETVLRSKNGIRIGFRKRAAT